LLQKILEAAGIESASCANLLGISPVIFSQWVVGQRPIPESYVGLLATVLGVPSAEMRMTPKQAKTVSSADITPAIWYKFRGEDLGPADRECAILIRQLAFFINETEEIAQKRAIGWESLFDDLRRATDKQAPPKEQGRQAARIFAESRGLLQGARGIGDVFRGNLRSLGILVVENAFPDSKLEGCSFFVGQKSAERPCIFANSFKSTWFRRNAVLLHEVAHAIFDAANDGASVDLSNSESADISEVRAQAFAQEVIAAKEILRHAAQRNHINWNQVSPRDLARLVSEVHAEPKTLLGAAADANFIDAELAKQYSEYDISELLPQYSEHALSTEQYIKKFSQQPEWIGRRTTTVPSRTLRLPSSYIESVLQLVRDGEISRGKCAELLMIDEDTLEQRFGELAPAL